MSFDGLLQFEINNLSSNRKTIQDKTVHEMLIHSIKGKYVKFL